MRGNRPAKRRLELPVELEVGRWNFRAVLAAIPPPRRKLSTQLARLDCLGRSVMTAFDSSLWVGFSSLWVGFAHEYRPPAKEEPNFTLERRWRKLRQTLDPDDFTDARAVAAVAWITRGNVRLLDQVTDDVVEATSSTLVIGIS